MINTFYVKQLKHYAIKTLKVWLHNCLKRVMGFRLQLEWKKTRVVSLTRARMEEYVVLSMVLLSAHAQKDICRLSAKSEVKYLRFLTLLTQMINFDLILNISLNQPQ